MEVCVDSVAVAKNYHDHLGAVDRVDTAKRRDPERPNISVAVQLMLVEFSTSMIGIVLEAVKSVVEPPLGPSGKSGETLIGNGTESNPLAHRSVSR